MKKVKRLLFDAALLRALIAYDPLTGICTWKIRPLELFDDKAKGRAWNTRYAGKVIGSEIKMSCGKTYRYFWLFNKQCILHRAIWCMVTGQQPDEVDHDNGNGLDNRWLNLKNVNSTGNKKNIRRLLSRALPTGVYEKKNGRFCSGIQVERKKIHLGVFDTVAEAEAVRLQANKKYGFNPNHGKIRPL